MNRHAQVENIFAASLLQREPDTVRFYPNSNQFGLSNSPIKNPIVTMDLAKLARTFEDGREGRFNGVLRIVFGAHIENRIVNSLETIESVISRSPPFSGRAISYGGRDDAGHWHRSEVIYLNSGGFAFRTDIRDLSYYFMDLNVATDTIAFGRTIRSNTVILKRTTIKRNGSNYGSLSFSCFQSNPGEVTLSCRAGTQYLSLPYTTLTYVDSNNFLAAQESFGRFGFFAFGDKTAPRTLWNLENSTVVIRNLVGPIAVATSLRTGVRSASDPYTFCGGDSDAYVWNGAGTPTPGNPPPEFVDPNPPQVGDTTTISTIGGITLSYDNAGEYKDLLRFNGDLIRTLKIENRLYQYPYVNRIDLAKLGWGLVGAASDERITARALGTGGNTDFPRTLILKKIGNNFIGFLRLYPASQLNIPILTFPRTTLLTLSSTDGYLDPNSQAVKNIETILNFDINGDGSVGNPAPPAPPQPGTINISTIRNVVLSYDTAGVEKDLLKVNGSLIKDQNDINVNYSDYINNSYEAIAAGTVNNENFLVWRTPANGVPFAKSLVQAFPADNRLTNNPSEIRSKVTNVDITSIPIRFSYPVTGVSISAFELRTPSGPISLRGATVTGSGQNYTLTLPSRRTTVGLNEIRVFSSNITATVNGVQVTMKQPSRLYWVRNSLGNLTQAQLDAYTGGAPSEQTTLVVWKMSPSWKLISGTPHAIYALNSSGYYQAETDFATDFNSDGKIGNPDTPPQDPNVGLSVIENTGNVLLSYDQNDNLRANGILITYNGASLKKSNTSWEFIAAENLNNTNCLLLKSKENGSSYIFRLDPNWSYVSADTLATPGSDAFFNTETLFNIDIDKDGIIGRQLPPVNIPTQPGSNLVLTYDRQGGQANLLKINGTLVKDFNNNNINIANYLNVKWQPVSAGIINGVKSIVWKYTDNGSLHFWRLNDSFVQTSADGLFMPGSPPFYAIETSFNLDFNNDGKIGNPTVTPPTTPSSPSSTVIESIGNVTLAYNQNNELTANGNIVKFNNVAIKRAPNDWAFLAAENINGINTLLAQWKESGYLHFMQFDNNWNSTGGTGWYAPGSADFLAVERLFGTDIDKDGTIGSSITLTSNFTTLTEALSNSTITPTINLSTKLSLDSNVGVSYVWQYNLGSGWVDWTLSQSNSRTNSSINVVFQPSYTTLKIRCKITLVLPSNSLAFSVFGGNLEIMSDELTINKKAETNYVAVRSPVPLTFTYNRGSSFNLDDLPKFVQDSLGAISGGDLGPDYITGIPSSWTPLCSPVEQDKCNTYQQAKNNGVYGTRLLKPGQTYTIYPRPISFRPFIIDFENI